MPQRTDGSSALAFADSPLGGMSTYSATRAQLAAQQSQWAGMSAGQPYPDMPKVPDDRPLLTSIGATGVSFFAGIINDNGEYNPDFFWRQGVAIYDEMDRSDAQVFAVQQMLELPIRRATWTVQPASDDPMDLEIASFVQSCLFEEMEYETSTGRVRRQKWDDILRHALSMFKYGFAGFEVNWRLDDGWVKWSRWTPLLARTFWHWWVGPDTELEGVQLWTFRDYGYEFVNVPADKLLLFTHREEGNNYTGRSIWRSAYAHWFYKQQFQKIEAIALERSAVVPPVITLPPNPTPNDIRMAKEIVQNVRAHKYLGVTIPHDWMFDYPRNQAKYAAQTQPAIQYHDIMIARNALCQFINLGSTETGAYSLDQSQLATFRANLQAQAEYVEDVINNDAIRRLVDYNYTGVAVYPKIKCSKIGLQDLAQLSTLLQTLTAYLPPSPELSDWLAQEIGLPVAPGSVVNATNPGSPATPDRPPTQPDDHNTRQTTQQSADASNTDGSGDSAEDSGGAGDDGGSASMMERIEASTRLFAEAAAAISGTDVVERGLLFGAGYNPYRDSHGRFAPGPHAAAARSGEGEGGGGSERSGGAGKGERVSAPKASGGARGGGSSRSGAAKGEAAKARISVRAHNYHGQDGYLISGHDTQGRQVSIFSKSRSEAERMRDDIKAGKEPKIDTEKATAERSSGGTRGAKAGKAEESVHERSARLQREGGLRPETRPGAELKVEGPQRNKGTEEDIINPAAPRASQMLDIYGEHNLGAALSRYNPATVKEIAERDGVPAARTKAETVSRITAHLTNGRYSANFPKEQKATTAASREPKAAKTTTTTRAPRTGSTKPAKTRAADTTLKPIRQVDHILNPVAAPDAHFLARLYGGSQLHAALNRYPMSRLRETAANLGVTVGRSKAATIASIVTHMRVNHPDEMGDEA